MKSTLDELWYSYQFEKSAIMNEEQRKILDTLMLNGKELQSQLNQEQNDLLEKYVENIHEIDSISERKAFISGVRFATAFLFEALNDNFT